VAFQTVRADSSRQCLAGGPGFISRRCFRSRRASKKTLAAASFARPWKNILSAGQPCSARHAFLLACGFSGGRGGTMRGCRRSAPDGLSTREIAKITGWNHSTIARDLAAKSGGAVADATEAVANAPPSAPSTTGGRAASRAAIAEAVAAGGCGDADGLRRMGSRRARSPRSRGGISPRSRKIYV
jgi:hypothetical protein